MCHIAVRATRSVDAETWRGAPGGVLQVGLLQAKRGMLPLDVLAVCVFEVLHVWRKPRVHVQVHTGTPPADQTVDAASALHHRMSAKTSGRQNMFSAVPLSCIKKGIPTTSLLAALQRVD